MQHFLSRDDLVADLISVGLGRGDTVMVHSAISKVGEMINGPDTLIAALCETVGPDGTLMAYTDWDARYEALLDAGGHMPNALRGTVAGFDAQRSRAVRDNGVLPEFLRTTPGALRSANPGASVTALGARAEWLTREHPLDYGYGPGSPLARLVACGGKVIMIGAPHDTMTLIHHAEHLANIKGKRIKRWDVPFAHGDSVVWRRCEEFDTSIAVCAELDDIDYFDAIVRSYLDAGRGQQGHVGQASTVVVEARAIVDHAISWLESAAP